MCEGTVTFGLGRNTELARKQLAVVMLVDLVVLGGSEGSGDTAVVVVGGDGTVRQERNIHTGRVEVTGEQPGNERVAERTPSGSKRDPAGAQKSWQVDVPDG